MDLLDYAQNGALVDSHVKIGEHGVVSLIDCMPRVVKPGENWDHAVLQAARVSYGAQDKKTTPEEDRGLIRYLWRMGHGTPFEMVDIKFYLALPIFVARQLIRHRMASVNEYSMRYKEPKDEFFIPDTHEIRKQSKNNKQGSEGQVDENVADRFSRDAKITAFQAMERYADATKNGIGKEIARINLPVSTFTYWYWEIDLRNFLGFLKLRLDKHAQKEIRDYAEAMYSIVKPLAPWTFEAFEDFTLNSVTLTAAEVNAIQTGELPFRTTKREQDEWQVKRDKLLLNAKWQSMDKAPRDGTEIVLRVTNRAGIQGKCLVGHWMPGGHCIEDHPAIDEGWYFWNGCIFDKTSKPLEWTPLPS